MGTSTKTSYIIVIIGTLLAAINSIVPFYDDAYQLKFGTLLWSMVPYYVYLLLSGIVSGAKLIVPGIFMIFVDTVARVYSWRYIPADSVTIVNLYLPVFLLFVMLPAGYFVGTRISGNRQG